MSDSIDSLRGDATARERAAGILWHQGGSTARGRQPYLYAILDAARDPRIYQGLRGLAATEQIASLDQGRAARELAAVSPYLVCLGTSDRVFQWIWEQGWGQSWGIFFWSLVSTETLRSHFRRLTLVQTDGGERLLFRFYDPRVLRPFAPTCDAAQVKELFGPVQRYMMEDESGSSILTYRVNGDQVTTSVDRLDRDG